MERSKRKLKKRNDSSYFRTAFLTSLFTRSDACPPVIIDRILQKKKKKKAEEIAYIQIDMAKHKHIFFL